ncbi:MAG: hypothetical protein ACI8RZ_005975 [Myxococcota bacterium]|jgi:hypothetical protein
MKRLFSALIPLLLLSGCPESSTPTTDESGGKEVGNPGNEGGNSPFSNPNDARFSVAPGTGVKLSGTFDYADATPGNYRIDFQKRESANGPPMLVHTIELDAPGAWSLEVPKDYGPIYLTGFVDLKGDGPSPDDPLGRTTEPVLIGTEPIEGVTLTVALGNDAGLSSPPKPGDNKPGTPEGTPGEPAPDGAPGGDPNGGAPGTPPPDAPPPDAPPDAPPEEPVPTNDGPPSDG